MSWREFSKAYPLPLASKAGSKLLFCRASLPENRSTLFRTHSSAGLLVRLKDNANFHKADSQAQAYKIGSTGQQAAKNSWMKPGL
jgi:hypothetical protein